jgi:phosphoadenosine phosphosulfate reductase
MFGQLNFAGLDKAEQSIKRLQLFEPAEGYVVAFSGGKDSICVYQLAKMAGVKFYASYNVTSVDPPELVYFIKEHYPDVEFNYPRYPDGKQITMWNLILRKGIPTRQRRFCCAYLKEASHLGEFVVTGVRWEESVRRASRGGLEYSDNKSGMRERIDPDNPSQETIHICQQKAQRILNPIIDWTTADVWAFIKDNGFAYPSLYDEGKRRLGCIGCPMGHPAADFIRWPKYGQAYLRAFTRIFNLRRDQLGSEADGFWGSFETAGEMFDWWTGGGSVEAYIEGKKGDNHER